jgi:hypothetical protein
MTEPTTEAVWPPTFAVLSSAERETRTRHFIETLMVALEATKLAIEAPRRVGIEQPAIPRIFESWDAANLMVHEVFEHLYAQARYTLGVIKPTPAQD